MKRVLFICGKARQRSPTAEQYFAKHPDMETDSAGLSNDADVILDREQIEWAETIAVMEKRQLGRLKRKYPRSLAGKRIVCLDIANNYALMQPELIELLEQRKGRLGV